MLWICMNLLSMLGRGLRGALSEPLPCLSLLGGLNSFGVDTFLNFDILKVKLPNLSQICRLHIGSTKATTSAAV